MDSKAAQVMELKSRHFRSISEMAEKHTLRMLYRVTRESTAHEGVFTFKVDRDNWKTVPRVARWLLAKKIKIDFTLDASSFDTKDLVFLSDEYVQYLSEQPNALPLLAPLFHELYERSLLREDVNAKLKWLALLEWYHSQRGRNLGCPLAMSHLEVFPDARVQVCCPLEELKLGDLRTESLLEIWNSSGLAKLQREFREGVSTTCSSHIEALRCNHDMYGLSQSIDTIGNGTYPLSLGLSLGHACNLKCVMCGVIENTEDALFSDLTWAKENSEVLRNIKLIDMKGGEPFIQKRVLGFVEYVHQINPRCLWNFVTNGNVDFTGELKSLLSKIPLNSLTISIDSLEEDIYSKIRLGGNLERALKFLEEVSEYFREEPVEIGVSTTLQRANWRSIPKLVDFASERALSLSVFPVVSPAELSLATCDKDTLIKMNQFFFQLDPNETSIIYSKIINFIRNAMQ